MSAVRFCSLGKTNPIGLNRLVSSYSHKPMDGTFNRLGGNVVTAGYQARVCTIIITTIIIITAMMYRCVLGRVSDYLFRLTRRPSGEKPFQLSTFNLFLVMMSTYVHPVWLLISSKPSFAATLPSHCGRRRSLPRNSLALLNRLRQTLSIYTRWMESHLCFPPLKRLSIP